jgi:hypothetical protein
MKKTNKTIVYTIVYAIDAEHSLDGGGESILDTLRGYGAAEIIDVKVVDKSVDQFCLDQITNVPG